MKIVITGGSGRIGTRLAALLADRHTVTAVSRRSGVDLLTGAGLPAALDGADVLVDLTDAPNFDDAATFFATAGQHLREAVRKAGVRHHIALSVAGADRMTDRDYMRGKIAQEELIGAAGVPHTIVRATQFFEFLTVIADAATTGGEVRLPPVSFQPVAADDVAAFLATAVSEPPRNAVVELGGPEVAPMSDMIRRRLTAAGDPRKVIDDPAAGYFGTPVGDRTLITAPGAHRGPTTLAQWLSRGAGD